MRKIRILLLFSLFALSKNIKAQDTLATLQAIVANKSTYIGGSFSSFINQLPLEIRYFFPGTGSQFRAEEAYTSFAFYFPASLDILNKTYPRLKIYWQTNQNRNQSFILYNQSRGAWSSTISSHYGLAIISNIELLTGGVSSY